MNTKTIYKSENGKKLLMENYESLIKTWPVKYKELNINTEFGKTFIIKSGNSNKPPLILLHGSSTNSAMWIEDIKEFSKDYCVYAIDILGEAGKSDETRLDLNTNQYANWLNEVMEKLNLDKVSIVSNSLGAWIALLFSINFPKKVSKLVLLAPSGLTTAKLSFLFKIIPLIFLGNYGLNKISKIATGSDNIPKEAMDYTMLIMKHYKPRVGSLPVFSDENLKKLSMPILYMGGENDALLKTNKSANRLKLLKLNTRISIVKNTGHILFGKASEILNFLNKNK